mgnify:CR=1 FL=1
MPDYTLSAKITGDSSNYQKAIKDANESTEQFQKNTSSLGSKLAGGLRTGLTAAAGAIAGVSAAMGAGVVAGVKYNATIENYQTSFEVMTGSAEKAAEVVDRLKEIGASTPFELPELADTTQLLMNYGFTADEAIEKMQMLGDISQGSADKMQRIATAYGQMSSAGKVQLEDVKQMIEAGFNPLQEISESTGESMQSLYDRISSGTLAVDEITASMQRATSEGGKYYQSMEKQSQTISGMISTLKDNAQQLLGDVVQPISDSMVSTLLPAAIDAIDQMSNAFQTQGVDGLIQAGSQILVDLLTGMAQKLPDVIEIAVQIIESIVDGLNNNMSQIITAAGQILLSLISGIAQLLPSLGELALNIIWTLVSGLITNAPQLMTQANTMFTDFCMQIQTRLPELIQRGAEMISNLLTGLLANMPQIMQQASSMMMIWLDTIWGMLPSILQSGADIILNLLNGLVSNAPQILSQAGQMLIDYIATIASNLPAVLQKGIEIIGQLLAGIIQAVPDLIASIPGILADIGSAFLDKDWGEIGLNIIKGIASGIAGAVGTLVDAAKEAAGNALDSVKDFLGIESPSKVFRDQVGKYMALGIGVGFQDNIPLNDMQRALDLNVSRMSMNYSPTSPYPTYPKSIYQNTNAERSDAVGMELLGNYIVNAMIEYGNRQGQALEKGISKMGLYVDGRQAGRFISDMGFVRR